MIEWILQLFGILESDTKKPYIEIKQEIVRQIATGTTIIVPTTTIKINKKIVNNSDRHTSPTTTNVPKTNTQKTELYPVKEKMLIEESLLKEELLRGAEITEKQKQDEYKKDYKETERLRIENKNINHIKNRIIIRHNLLKDVELFYLENSNTKIDKIKDLKWNIEELRDIRKNMYLVENKCVVYENTWAGRCWEARMYIDTDCNKHKNDICYTSIQEIDTALKMINEQIEQIKSNLQSEGYNIVDIENKTIIFYKPSIHYEQL